MASHYDCIVIGAGMSGLAAAIRLAMYDVRVLVLERHNAVGGLNSFYSLEGRKYDVGLHAMTNYVPPAAKGAPLTKLLRQLRLKHADLDLAEQCGSRIAFPGFELAFTNDFSVLESEVAREFPAQVDGFRRLVAKLHEFDETKLVTEEHSARALLKGYLRNSPLVDALLLPTCYYGSARENDMDLTQFAIMFRALFFEGFARPFEGVRRILRLLRERLKEAGGERRMKCGVSTIHHDGGRATALELDDGSTVTADHVLSSIGWAETLRLMGKPPAETASLVGRLSFVETLAVLKRPPVDYGWEDTIVFFNDAERFTYACPSGLVDPRSGVICFPNNYRYSEGRSLEEGWLRVTALANYDRWAALRSRDRTGAADGGASTFGDDPSRAYTSAKDDWFVRLQDQALRFLPGEMDPENLSRQTIARDMFSPTTITRYTGHLRGAIYGAPCKNKPGTTELENLYLCGTDQGFLGITGAMLSGISMANAHVLSRL
ncbi:MAG: phytoene desaturase family protein [Opitutales bacterium]